MPEHENYLIDIDGTITDDVPNEEPERMKHCEPFPDAVDRINTWYAEGHTITFFTSRTDEHREITLQWLSRWGFQFHHLLMNKPRGGRYRWLDNHEVTGVKYAGQDWSDLRL